MPDSSTERLSPSLTPRERMIRRIAAALDRPETLFLDEQAPGPDAADQAELLRIWNGLTDPADRRRILTFARAVASDRSEVVQP